MAQISFRMDDDLKAAAETTFKSMGMTLSTAITIFVTQAVKQQRFPFPIEAGGKVVPHGEEELRTNKTQKGK